MRVMLRISLDKDSYLARIKQANDKINEHYRAMSEIARRLKYLSDYTNCETTSMNQSNEAVYDCILVEINADSLLVDIEKAQKEMENHSRAIGEIIDNLSAFNGLKRYVKADAVSE